MPTNRRRSRLILALVGISLGSLLGALLLGLCGVTGSMIAFVFIMLFMPATVILALVLEKIHRRKQDRARKKPPDDAP